jgi:hypothetical protein
MPTEGLSAEPDAAVGRQTYMVVEDETHITAGEYDG